MALARIHNWISLEALSASDLNAEYNNLINYLNGTSVSFAGVTFTGDVLFTDATYDIGKTGATRPRDGFFSRNLNVAGTATLTGNVAFGGSWGDASVAAYGMTAGHIAQITGANSTNYQLIVQSTAAAPTFVQQFSFSAAAPNDGTSKFWQCDDSGTTRAKMLSNGGLSNFSANNVNLSDARVKPEAESLASAGAIPALWDAHKTIAWSRFKYADQTHGDWNYGYIAQDVQAVMPALVDKWDDKSDLLAVYQEDLHNIGHAVLAEAQRKIEKLEAQVAALLKAAGIA